MLSPRQKEVLSMLVDGYTSKQIANRLGISEGTVRWHQGETMKKLGARNTVHAAVIAVKSSAI